jgi:alpha-glucosidase
MATDTNGRRWPCGASILRVPTSRSRKAEMMMSHVAGWRRLSQALCAIAIAVSSGVPLAAQGPADTDGDGVADTLDCNPADPRVASAHTYYFDRDGDLSGNANDAAVICSAVPFAGTTLWSGDPDDGDATQRAAVVPRGERRLGLDLNDTSADGRWRPDLARELGADVATLHLLWSQVETAPGQFNGPQAALLDAVAGAYVQHGLSINLTLSPLSQTYLTVPADIAGALQAGTMTFSSPAFIARFNAFADFVRNRLSAVDIQALQIGHEIDRFFEINPGTQFWSQYGEFFVAARAHVQSQWGGQLSVGMTSTAGGLVTAPVSLLMSALNGAADHVSATYVPRLPGFEMPAATDVRGDVQRVIATAYPKKLMFQAVGATSTTVSRSSAARQAQFYEAFFAVWDEYAPAVPFAAIARLFDWSDARSTSEAQAPHLSGGAPAAAFVKSLGLRNYATGQAKAAYDTVRILAVERGFWRAQLPAIRSTFVGFTPAQYDRPGTGIEPAVLQTLMQRIGSNADLMLLQFDNGVPWPEALADSGAGPLPYSANVRDTWEAFRASRPPGTRLAVALNPLGVPRRDLAPYWGIGEDFVLNDQLEPVGTGVIRDFHDRLLPPDWRDRSWDDPAVKTAFTSYAKRAISFFRPDYLLIGIEANLALEPDAAAYARFLDLQRHVYEALKADPATAGVPIIVSFAAEHMMVDRLGTHYLIDGESDAAGLRQQHLDALAASAPYLDMIGFSTYPLKTLFGTSRPPASMFDHLMEAARTVTAKPVAITETGYPVRAFTVKNQVFSGSPEKQAQFYQLLFADAEKYDFEFVTSFTPYDMTPYMDLLRSLAAQTPPAVTPSLVEFYKYFEYMGLFEPDGAMRPAGTWLAEYLAQPLQREEAWITPVSVSSPSGNITASIAVAADGHLYYTVDRAGQRIIDPSPLGQIVDGANLGESIVAIELSAPADVDETYPTRGVHRTARSHYRGTTLTLRRATAIDRVVKLQFRAFDDGVAYRYEVPGEGTRTIGGEVSAWTLPESSRLWHQVNTENYEANYRGTELGFFDDDIGGPVTAELPDGGYVVLTEAALTNYSGMTYDADLGSQTLRGEFLDSPSWTVPAGSVSPWRVVLSAATLNDLVNSDIVSNLNAAPDPALFPDGTYTSWIKPGRAVWSWWSSRPSGYSFDVQRQFVDLAHQLRAEYQVIDVGWEEGFPASGQDAFQRLSALTAYARAQWRDVGVWVWKYWYELEDPAARNEFFARAAAAGAVGVKIDNVYGIQSDSFTSVAMQEAILRDAAAHRLMINFHGVGKSTGLQRTYPNEMTREGFMGLELNGLAWDQGLFVTPEHNAAAPFVRLVVGPGDYTPVTLDPRKIGDTTFAHQLATAGVFTSPVQHWADHPEVLLQQPIAARLLRMIPVEWEETVVLPPSRIGALAMFARKSAGRWYIFAINGDSTNGRSLPSVSLDFLGPGRWTATTISDGTPATLVETSLDNLTAASTLNMSMAAGGGFVAVIAPAPDIARPVRQGFSSIPPMFTAEGWQRGYTMLRDHADLVSHSLQEGVPWPEALLSSDPDTYSDHLRMHWQLMRSANEAVIPATPRYLMLNPIETISYARLAPYLGERDYMPLPAPWDTYDFNHPNVKQAFTNFAIAAIDYFQPSYVAIGIEANILLAKRPDKWAAYKELNAHVYQALKQRYPSLLVFTTVQYEQMLGFFEESENLAAQLRAIYPHVLEGEVLSLLDHSDLFALSSYPFMVQNNPLVGADSRLDRDYYDRAALLARFAGKRLAFEQTGYISRDLFAATRNVTLPGSEEMQRAYVEHLLTASHIHDTEFVVNFVAIDYGTNYGDNPATSTWAYTGLQREDGTFKPALAVWDAFRSAPPASSVLSQQPQSSIPGAATLPSFDGFAAAIQTLDGQSTLPSPGAPGGAPSPELFVRWQQFASFFPSFDPPAAEDPTAPWGFAEPYRGAAQATLARRDAFLPYLQPLFERFQVTGQFALRRLSGDGDPPLFMVGDWVLLAPVIVEGAASREVQLPAGASWIDWHTGQVFAGSQTIVVDTPIDRIPLFIRQEIAP